MNMTMVLMAVMMIAMMMIVQLIIMMLVDIIMIIIKDNDDSTKNPDRDLNLIVCQFVDWIFSKWSKSSCKQFSNAPFHWLDHKSKEYMSHSQMLGKFEYTLPAKF